jgi:hypothetical protein
MHATAPHGRAFTVIELVTALAMSGFVALAAFSLIALLGRSDAASSQSVNNATNMAITYHGVARAMQRLVAATPIPASDAEALNAANRNDAAQPSEDNAQRARGGVSDDLPIESAIADTSQPPFFDLHYISTEFGNVPRLELVVETPPVGRQQNDLPTLDQRLAILRAEWLGSVRGAFELMPTANGWSLIWAPIDPPGQIVELMPGLVQCSWEVLPRSDKESSAWQQLYSAYLQPDFPVAVRLQFVTADGTEADWLFETATITEGR